MPLTLLYSDDLSGYANDAAFKAAYPYDPPTDMTSSATVDSAWGATNGPDGQPGVMRVAGLGSSGFDVFPLSPTCKQFRVAGRWSFAPLTADIGQVMSVWYATPGNRAGGAFAGNVVIISCSTTGALTISVKTTAAYQNATGHVYFETVPGAFTPSTPFDLVVDGTISTLVETSPGVWEPNADGHMAVSVNGGSIFSFTGPIWHNDSGLNASPGYWNGVAIRGGKFANLQIWHETGCDEVIADTSDPCCATGDGGDVVPTGGGQGAGAQPVQYAAIGVQLECAGGGLVPTQASLVHAETWWGA